MRQLPYSEGRAAVGRPTEVLGSCAFGGLAEPRGPVSVPTCSAFAGRFCWAELHCCVYSRKGPGFPCGEHAPHRRTGHVASKYVVARSVAKCLSDLRTVPVA